MQKKGSSRGVTFGLGLAAKVLSEEQQSVGSGDEGKLMIVGYCTPLFLKCSIASLFLFYAGKCPSLILLIEHRWRDYKS